MGEGSEEAAHLVELGHVGGPNEHRVLRILKLHLDAHLGVSDNQLSPRI